MAERGAAEEEIAEAKARFQERRDDQSGGGSSGMGRGMGMGPGFGRYMPEDFRAMGALFHDAAAAFAETAGSVAPPATSDDYETDLDGLRGVTTACRGCHEAYRVAPSN